MKVWITAWPLCAPLILIATAIIFCIPVDARTWTEDAQLCYVTQGNIELKISYCTRAIESGLLNDFELATTYTNRGSALQGRGDLDRAMTDYNAALRIKPDKVQALVAR